jgi:hypothetical protein
VEGVFVQQFPIDPAVPVRSLAMGARLSLFFAALMLAGPSPAQTTRPGAGAGVKTYRVRHVFHPGEKLLLISETQFEFISRPKEGISGAAGKHRHHAEWQVVTGAPAKDNAALVRLRMLRARSESQNNGEKKTTDSDKPETLSPHEREELQTILKAVFLAEFDDKGVLRELTVPQEVVAETARSAQDEYLREEGHARQVVSAAIRAIVESFTVYQPAGPVFVGQTWAAERKGPEGGAGAKVECKLVRVERTSAGRIATVAFKLRPDPDAAGRGETRKLKGQARYNIDRGRFVSSKAESSHSSGDGSYEMRNSVSMELRELPRPASRPGGGKHAIRHVFRPGSFLLVLTIASERKPPGPDGAERPRPGREAVRLALTVTRSPNAKATVVRIDHPLPGPEQGKLTCVAELDDQGTVRKFSVDEADLENLLKGAEARRPGLKEERRKHLRVNLGGLLEELTFYQPARAVSVGESWNVRRSRQLDPEREETECRLIQVAQTPAGRIATILLTGKIERTPPAAGAEKAKSGEVCFNLDRQEFVSARWDLRALSREPADPARRRERKTTLELRLRSRSEPSSRPGADKAGAGAKQ